MGGVREGIWIETVAIFEESCYMPVNSSVCDEDYFGLYFSLKD